MERFKLALISHDPAWASTVFPNWHTSDGEPKGEVQYEYVDDIDEDEETEGTWVMPEMTAEERERLLAETLSNPRGTFTIEDLDEEEGWV